MDLPDMGGSQNAAPTRPEPFSLKRHGLPRVYPGRCGSFFMRVMARRGSQVAAVATARKLATIVWHLLNRQEDYVFARPSLVARKQRAAELRAGRPSQRGRRGIAAGYYCAETRADERARLENAERAYERVVGGWRQSGSGPK